MEEAQRLADRVVVLARGQVVAEGAPDELGRGDTVVGFRLPAFHDTLPLPVGASVERDTVSFRTETPTRDLAPLLEWAARRGMELEQLTVARPTLEDVYLDLTATEEVAA
jgi:ABC-2 type transport system ATP-binding protein